MKRRNFLQLFAIIGSGLAAIPQGIKLTYDLFVPVTFRPFKLSSNIKVSDELLAVAETEFMKEFETMLIEELTNPE